MSLPRFFLDSQVIADEDAVTFELRLRPDDLHHLYVLRLSPGEHIAVVDAASDYFECRLERIEKDAVFVSVCSHEKMDALPARVVLFQALPKGSKLDDVVRHATELGVDGFRPFISERSIVRLDGARAEKRTARLQEIARSAAMQSGRHVVPPVSEILPFKRTLDKLSKYDMVLIFWEEATSADLATCIREFLGKGLELGRIAVVIGPEGGFSSEEVARIEGACSNTHVLSLGDTILRAETAGIVAPALVLYELGGLGGSVEAS